MKDIQASSSPGGLVTCHIFGSLPSDIHARRRLLAALVDALRPEQIPDVLRDALGNLDRHLDAEQFIPGLMPALDCTPSTPTPSRGNARLGETIKKGKR